MDPIADLRYDTFKDRAGETFAIRDSDVELTLVSVHDRGPGSGTRPQGSFTLLFSGPAASPLEQAIVPLRHADLGDLDVFVVPVAREGDTLHYECVFN